MERAFRRAACSAGRSFTAADVRRSDAFGRAFGRKRAAADS
jgi:hypothetical protein